jgi:hypothetical protein
MKFIEELEAIKWEMERQNSQNKHEKMELKSQA